MQSFKRITSALTLLLFSWETIVWAAPPIASPIREISIPESIGSIKERFVGSSSSLIIHIQDAHSHPEAQQNIQAILQYLAREKKIRKVAVEGAFGKIEPEILNLFSDHDANEAVAQRLAAMGELTGAELFAFHQKGGAVDLQGVDHPELYVKSFQIFQKIKSARRITGPWFRSYNHELDKLEGRIFNPELAHFFSQKKSWERDHEHSFTYFKTLQTLSQKYLQLELSEARNQFEWPNLSRLLKAEETESHLRIEAAQSEAETLARELQTKLSAGKKRDDLVKGLSHLRENSGTRLFFETLYEESRKAKISLLNYPELLNLGGLLILREEIDAPGLFQEIEKLEGKLEEKLALRADEKKLLELVNDFSFTEKLFTLTLTREEYKTYQEGKKDFAPEVLESRLRTIGRTKSRQKNTVHVAEIAQLAERFYSLSRQRDQALLENTLKLAAGDSSKATVLIAGGFHSEGITELLKEKGISYLVIAPKMTRFEDGELYEKVMTGKNADPQSLFTQTSQLVSQLLLQRNYLPAGTTPHKREILLLETLLREGVRPLEAKGYKGPQIYKALQEALRSAQKSGIVDQARLVYNEAENEFTIEIPSLHVAAKEALSRSEARESISEDVILRMLQGKWKITWVESSYGKEGHYFPGLSREIHFYTEAKNGSDSKDLKEKLESVGREIQESFPGYSYRIRNVKGFGPETIYKFSVYRKPFAGSLKKSVAQRVEPVMSYALRHPFLSPLLFGSVVTILYLELIDIARAWFPDNVYLLIIKNKPVFGIFSNSVLLLGLMGGGILISYFLFPINANKILLLSSNTQNRIEGASRLGRIGVKSRNLRVKDEIVTALQDFLSEEIVPPVRRAAESSIYAIQGSRSEARGRTGKERVTVLIQQAKNIFAQLASWLDPDWDTPSKLGAFGKRSKNEGVDAVLKKKKITIDDIVFILYSIQQDLDEATNELEVNPKEAFDLIEEAINVQEALQLRGLEGLIGNWEKALPQLGILVDQDKKYDAEKHFFAILNQVGVPLLTVHLVLEILTKPTDIARVQSINEDEREEELQEREVVGHKDEYTYATADALGILLQYPLSKEVHEAIRDVLEKLQRSEARAKIWRGQLFTVSPGKQIGRTFYFHPQKVQSPSLYEELAKLVREGPTPYVALAFNDHQVGQGLVINPALEWLILPETNVLDERAAAVTRDFMSLVRKAYDPAQNFAGYNIQEAGFRIARSAHPRIRKELATRLRATPMPMLLVTPIERPKNPPSSGRGPGNKPKPLPKISPSRSASAAKEIPREPAVESPGLAERLETGLRRSEERIQPQNIDSLMDQVTRQMSILINAEDFSELVPRLETFRAEEEAVFNLKTYLPIRQDNEGTEWVFTDMGIWDLRQRFEATFHRYAEHYQERAMEGLKVQRTSLVVMRDATDQNELNHIWDARRQHQLDPDHMDSHFIWEYSVWWNRQAGLINISEFLKPKYERFPMSKKGAAQAVNYSPRPAPKGFTAGNVIVIKRGTFLREAIYAVRFLSGMLTAPISKIILNGEELLPEQYEKKLFEALNRGAFLTVIFDIRSEARQRDSEDFFGSYESEELVRDHPRWKSEDPVGLEKRRAEALEAAKKAIFGERPKARTIEVPQQLSTPRSEARNVPRWAKMAALGIFFPSFAQAQINPDISTPPTVAQSAPESRALSKEEKIKPPTLEEQKDVKRLIEALKDEASNVRASAAQSLGKIKDPRAVPALIEALKNEYYDSVRLSEAEALGEIKDPRAVPTLIEALKDKYWRLRNSAAQALGEIKDPRAIPALTQALKDEYSDVRFSAAQALGEIKDPRAVSVLIEVLKDKYSNDVLRAIAVHSLIQIGPLSAPTLIEALKDKDSDVYERAFEALGKIKDPRAVPALIEVLKDEASHLTNFAAYALIEIGPPSVPALIEVLKDENYNIRKSAAQALGKIKDPKAVPALIEVLKDKDYNVRESAVRALGEIKDSKAVPALTQALKDEASNVRAHAAQALGQIGPPSVPALIEVLKDKDYNVRESAVRALGEIKDSKAVPALTQALKDEASNVRAHAAQALGEIKDPRAVPALTQALKDESYYVHRFAAEALGEIKESPRAVPTLTEALEDKGHFVPESTAQSRTRDQARATKDYELERGMGTIRKLVYSVLTFITSIIIGILVYFKFVKPKKKIETLPVATPKNTELLSPEGPPPQAPLISREEKIHEKIRAAGFLVEDYELYQDEANRLIGNAPEELRSIFQAFMDVQIDRAKNRLANALQVVDRKTTQAPLAPAQREAVLFAYHDLAPFLGVSVEIPKRFRRSEVRMDEETKNQARKLIVSAINAAPEVFERVSFERVFKDLDSAINRNDFPAAGQIIRDLIEDTAGMHVSLNQPLGYQPIYFLEEAYLILTGHRLQSQKLDAYKANFDPEEDLREIVEDVLWDKRQYVILEDQREDEAQFFMVHIGGSSLENFSGIVFRYWRGDPEIRTSLWWGRGAEELSVVVNGDLWRNLTHTVRDFAQRILTKPEILPVPLDAKASRTILEQLMKARSEVREETGREPGLLILMRHGETESSDTRPGGGYFAGHRNVPLTERGRNDAEVGGRALGAVLKNEKIDAAFTSDLDRAYDTLTTALQAMGRTDVPITRSPDIKERHYGILQGVGRQEVMKDLARRIARVINPAAFFPRTGKEKRDFAKSLAKVWPKLTPVQFASEEITKLAEGIFTLWRRSYDIAPPPDESGFSESLEDTKARAVPYLQTHILPRVMKRENILVSAHGNSLRAMSMELFGISVEEVQDFTFPLATPVIVRFNSDGKVKSVQIVQSTEQPSADGKNIKALQAILEKKKIPLTGGSEARNEVQAVLDQVGDLLKAPAAAILSDADISKWKITSSTQTDISVTLELAGSQQGQGLRFVIQYFPEKESYQIDVLRKKKNGVSPTVEWEHVGDMVRIADLRRPEAILEAVDRKLTEIKTQQGLQWLTARSEARTLKEEIQSELPGIENADRLTQDRVWMLLDDITLEAAGTDDALVPFLVDLVSHPLEWIRGKAVEALGRIGPYAANPTFSRLHTKEPEILTVLHAAVATDKSVHVRQFAREALGLISGEAPRSETRILALNEKLVFADGSEATLHKIDKGIAEFKVRSEARMLVLSRKQGETIDIGGISVTVIEITPDVIKVQIEPENVSIGSETSYRPDLGNQKNGPVTKKDQSRSEARNWEQPFNLQLEGWRAQVNAPRPIRHVIVIEDEPVLRKLFVMLVRRNVPEAIIEDTATVDEAWKNLRSGNYDLVLTDRNTPPSEMTGTRLIDLLRKKEYQEGRLNPSQQAVAVLISGNLDEAAEEGIDLNSFGPDTFYLRKPARFQDFQLLIATVGVNVRGVTSRSEAREIPEYLNNFLQQNLGVDFSSMDPAQAAALRNHSAFLEGISQIRRWSDEWLPLIGEIIRSSYSSEELETKLLASGTFAPRFDGSGKPDDSRNSGALQILSKLLAGAEPTDALYQQAVDIVEKILDRDQNHGTVFHGVEVLGQVGKRGILPLLQYTTPGWDEGIQHLAIAQLVKNKESAKLLLIPSLLKIPSEKERLYLAGILDRLGKPDHDSLYLLLGQDQESLTEAKHLWGNETPTFVELVQSRLFIPNGVVGRKEKIWERMEELRHFHDLFGGMVFSFLIKYWGFAAVSHWAHLDDLETKAPLFQLMGALTRKNPYQTPLAEALEMAQQRGDAEFTRSLLLLIVSGRTLAKRQLLQLLALIEKDPTQTTHLTAFLIAAMKLKPPVYGEEEFVQESISQLLNSDIRNVYYLGRKLARVIPHPTTTNPNLTSQIRDLSAQLDQFSGTGPKDPIFYYLRLKLHRDPDSSDLDLVRRMIDAFKSPAEAQKLLGPLIREQAKEQVIQSFLTPEAAQIGQVLQKIQEGKEIREKESPIFKQATLLLELSELLAKRYGVSREEGKRFASSEVIQAVEAGNILEAIRGLQEQRAQIKEKLLTPTQITPEMHIGNKRHQAPDEWGFNLFGFWGIYKEAKFDAFEKDRLLQAYQESLQEQFLKDGFTRDEVALNSRAKVSASSGLLDDSLRLPLLEMLEGLGLLLDQMSLEGLANRRLQVLNQILRQESLDLQQLHNVLFLIHGEENRLFNFFNFNFADYPKYYALSLGRKNVAVRYQRENENDLSDVEWAERVQNTFLTDLIAEEPSLLLLYRYLINLRQILEELIPEGHSFLIRPAVESKQVVNVVTSENFDPQQMSPIELGFKAYELFELRKEGYPVPALATLPADVPTRVKADPNDPEFRKIVIEAILQLEKETGKIFPFDPRFLKSTEQTMIQTARDAQGKAQLPANGNGNGTLTFSVRSGSFFSMPGLMDTVTNLPFNDSIAKRLINRREDPRFVLDTYRRFLSSFAAVHYGMDQRVFSDIIDRRKKRKALSLGVNPETFTISEFSVRDLEKVIRDFKKAIRQKDPDFNSIDPFSQVLIATVDVYSSWQKPGARNFRSNLGISDLFGTAVTFHEMISGNRDLNSGTAVIWSGDPDMGTRTPVGDYKEKSQGLDLVAGMTGNYRYFSKTQGEDSLEKTRPDLYRTIRDLAVRLHLRGGEYQDLEITVESGHVYLLQTRPLALTAMEFQKKLVPTSKVTVIGRGTPVSPNAAVGRILDARHITFSELKNEVQTLRERMERQGETDLDVILLFDYVGDEGVVKLGLPGVRGLINSKVGRSTHAALEARRRGLAYLADVDTLDFRRDGSVFLGKHKLNFGMLGPIVSIDAHSPEESPTGGQVIWGRVPFETLSSHRSEARTKKPSSLAAKEEGAGSQAERAGAAKRVAVVGDSNKARLLLSEMVRRGISVPIWAAQTPAAERLPFLTRDSHYSAIPSEQTEIIGDPDQAKLLFKIAKQKITPVVFSASSKAKNSAITTLIKILKENKIDTVVLDKKGLLDEATLTENGFRVVVVGEKAEENQAFETIPTIQSLTSFEVGRAFHELAERKGGHIQFGQLQIIEPNNVTLPSTYRIRGAGQLNVSRQSRFTSELERGLGLPKGSGRVAETLKLGYPITQGTIFSFVLSLDRRTQPTEILKFFRELAKRDGFFVIPEDGALLNTQRIRGEKGIYLLDLPIVETTEDGRSFILMNFVADPVQTEIEWVVQRLKGETAPRFSPAVRSYQETPKDLKLTSDDRKLADTQKTEVAEGEVRVLTERFARKWLVNQTKRALREDQMSPEDSVEVLFDRKSNSFYQFILLKDDEGARVGLIGLAKTGEIFATSLLSAQAPEKMAFLQRGYYQALRKQVRQIVGERLKKEIRIRDIYQPAENLSAIWEINLGSFVKEQFILSEIVQSQDGKDRIVASPKIHYQFLKEDEIGIFVNGAGGRIGSQVMRLVAGDAIAPNHEVRPLSGKLIPLAMGVSSFRDEEGRLVSGAEGFTHLIKSDPATGPFIGTVHHGYENGNHEDWVELTPAGGTARRIAVLSDRVFRNPENYPLLTFLMLDIPVEAIEATGIFSDLYGINKYLWAGAEEATITGPGSSKEEYWGTHTFVHNINNGEYHPRKRRISTASCTTSCGVALNDILQQVGAELIAGAPLPDSLLKEYRNPMTGVAITAHSYTGETLGPDLSYDPSEKTQGRVVASGAAYPAPSGFARTGKIVIPEVQATGMAIRGPWITGSLLAPVIDVPGHWTLEDIRRIAKRNESESAFRLLSDLTSSNQIQRMFGDWGSLHAAVNENQVRIVHTLDNWGRPHSIISIPAWYENEWGYSLGVARFLDNVVRPAVTKVPLEERAEEFPARLSAIPEEGQMLYSDRLFLNNFTDEDLQSKFRGKTVLVRTDYNVVEPRLEKNAAGKFESKPVITEDFRIKASAPDLARLQKAGAKVVVISHNGRFVDVVKNRAGYSLSPVAERLSELLGTEVKFLSQTVGPVVQERVKSLQEGEILLLENLRTDAGEEGGDSNYAQELYNSITPDAYVFAAFGAAHRGGHASINPLIHIVRREKPGAPVLGGELVQKELAGLREFLNDPNTGKSAVAILGGAKPADKIEIMREMIEKQRVKKIIVLGAMALYFYLAKGVKIGNSFLEDDAQDVEKSAQSAFEILELAEAKGVEIILPAGFRGLFHALDREQPSKVKVSEIHSISMDGTEQGLPSNFYAYSVDQGTVDRIALEIQNADWVILNGTAGFVESNPFRKENDQILQVVDREVRSHHMRVLILGGDGGAAFSQWARNQKIYGPEYLQRIPKEYTLSTAGGAALELFARQILSGLEPLDIEAEKSGKENGIPIAVYGNLKWRLRTPEGIRKQLMELVEEVKDIPDKENVEVAIFIPADLARDPELFKIVEGSPIKLGIQNVRLPSEQTNEVTAQEAHDLGFTHVLIGHSDRRRRIAGETNQVVNARLKASLAAGLTSLLLFGEDLEERLKEIKHPEKRGVVSERQLRESLKGVSTEQAHLIRFGYEPVWAIGKQAAGSFYANHQLTQVREILKDIFWNAEGNDFITGYGGGANERNIASYLSRGKISFVLAGRASVEPRAFAQMIHQATGFSRSEARMSSGADRVNELSLPDIQREIMNHISSERRGRERINRTQAREIRQAVKTFQKMLTLPGVENKVPSEREIFDAIVDSNLIHKYRMEHEVPLTLVFRGDIFKAYSGRKPRFIAVTFGKDFIASTSVHSDLEAGQFGFWKDPAKFRYALSQEFDPNRFLIAKGGSRWYQEGAGQLRDITFSEKLEGTNRRTKHFILENVDLSSGMSDKNPAAEVFFEGGKTVFLARSGASKQEVIEQWVASSITTGFLGRIYLAGPDMETDDVMDLMQSTADRVHKELGLYPMRVTTSIKEEPSSFNHVQWRITSVSVIETLLTILNNPDLMRRYGFNPDNHQKIDIVIQGFGDVGSGDVRYLYENYPELLNPESGRIRIVGVSKGNGGIYHPQGLDIKELLRLIEVRERDKNMNLFQEYFRGKNDRRRGLIDIKDGNEIYFVREHDTADLSERKPIVALPAANPDVFKSFQDIKRLREAGVRIIVAGANNVIRENEGLENQMEAFKILFVGATHASFGGIYSSTREIYTQLTEGIQRVRDRMEGEAIPGEKPSYEADHYRILTQDAVANLAVSLTHWIIREFNKSAPQQENVAALHRELARTIRTRKNDLLKNPEPALVERIVQTLDVVFSTLEERNGRLPAQLTRQLKEWVTLVVILNHVIGVARERTMYDNSQIKILQNRLRSGNVSDQRIAAYELGVMRTGSTELMLDVLDDVRRDARVRANVAEALGNFNDETAVPHFLNVLTDSNPHVRVQARAALAKFPGQVGQNGLERSELRKTTPLIEEQIKVRLGREGRNLPAVSWVTGAAAFRFVGPDLAVPDFIPFWNLNLFGIGTDGVTINLTPDQRTQILNSIHSNPAKNSFSEKPRLVVLVSVDNQIADINLETMGLGVGSQVIILDPAGAQRKAFDRYAKIKIPGVRIAQGHSMSRLPAVKELQQIFASTPNALPVLIFPAGYEHLLEGYEQAAEEGFAATAPRLEAARLAFASLLGRTDNAVTLRKQVPDSRLLQITSPSHGLVQVLVPAEGERNFAEFYLNFTRERSLQVSA